MEQHAYSVILDEGDPQENQPDTITVALKPHQLAALHKAKVMEQSRHIEYNVPTPRRYIPYAYDANPQVYGKFQLKTNIGVIGDTVGFGKTLIALSIIAHLKREKIDIPEVQHYTYQHHTSQGFIDIARQNPRRSLLENLVKTTLVIVPRGPVYIQWKEMIREKTKLKCLAIDSMNFVKKNLPATTAEAKEKMEEHDLVLIKNTTLQNMLLHFNNNPDGNVLGFDRIMIDEAHITALKVQNLHYKFLWFITSSYRDLVSIMYHRSIYNNFSTVIQHNQERLHYILVKGDDNFVRNSFEIPKPIEKYYVCQMTKTLSAIQSFLTANIQDMINVNDISGAIRELGGKAETEEDLVEIIVKDTEKDIANKEREIEFVRSLEIDEESKQHRLRTLQQDLQRLQTRKESLQARIKEVNQATCSICYDSLENPIYLSCSHIFCGGCLLRWMTSNIRTRNFTAHCPECRTHIDSSKLVAIIKEKEKEEGNVPMILSKDDQMIDIIQKKPNGRFLVFSRHDSVFSKIATLFKRNNISFCEIKGSTSHMMNILEDFKANRTQVILLNTHHAGCGIDISCATDVIIYHSMPDEKIQAVGRAQRVGRKDVLTIHNLCYSHEISTSTPTST